MLALMFIPMSGSQTAVQYDPWADMNDDGKIDIKDIAYSSRLFGTLGDPTKNVNVTNWPQGYEVQVLPNYNFSWNRYGMNFGWTTGPIFVGKYSRMSVMLVPKKWINARFNLHVNLTNVIWLMGNSGPYGTGAEMDDSQSNMYFSVSIRCDPYPPVYIPQMYTHKFAVIETKSPSVLLDFTYGSFDIDQGWVVFDIYIYLRNE
jgi:hypothetical protein